MLSTPRKPLNQDTRLPGLDALRFIAALSVVFYHLTYSIDGRALFPSLDGFTRYGYLGVDLFFMISGFVILWSAQGKSPADFVISRFSRLYPIFWVAILITVAVLSLFGAKIGIKQMVLNATMLAGYLQTEYIDGVYWTLQVEIKFYVMVFLLLVIGQISRAEQWACGWLCVTLLNEVTDIIPRGAILYPYCSYFIAGMVLFQIWSQGLSKTRALAFVVALGLSSHHASVQVYDFVNGDVRPWIPVLVIVFFHLLLLLVATKKITLQAVPLWTWLGAATYPLYLLHNRVGNALFDALPVSATLALLITLMAIASLTVLATLLDRKMHRWMRGALTGMRSPRSQTAVAGD